MDIVQQDIDYFSTPGIWSIELLLGRHKLCEIDDFIDVRFAQDTTIDESKNYCQHPYRNNKKIPFNNYYVDTDIKNSISYSITYFCKQDQLEYILVPRLFSTIPINTLFGIQIIFHETQNIWIPETT
ncbi:hypothetical protein WA158_000131 [Blastocystis sp. Blastoise]